MTLAFYLSCRRGVNGPGTYLRGNLLSPISLLTAVSAIVVFFDWVPFDGTQAPVSVIWHSAVCVSQSSWLAAKSGGRVCSKRVCDCGRYLLYTLALLALRSFWILLLLQGQPLVTCLLRLAVQFTSRDFFVWTAKVHPAMYLPTDDIG